MEEKKKRLVTGKREQRKVKLMEEKAGVLESLIGEQRKRLGSGKRRTGNVKLLEKKAGVLEFEQTN